MDDWLRNPAFWPVLASPLAVAGMLAMAAGYGPGPAGGAGFLAGWALTIPFGRAAARGAQDPSARHLRVAVAWVLLAGAVVLGGLWWAHELDPWAGLQPGEAF
jgi:hypothetical protein